MRELRAGIGNTRSDTLPPATISRSAGSRGRTVSSTLPRQTVAARCPPTLPPSPRPLPTRPPTRAPEAPPPKSRPGSRLLNVWVDDLTMSELMQRLDTGMVFTLNPDHLYHLQRNAAFFSAYRKAAFIPADSKYVF